MENRRAPFRPRRAQATVEFALMLPLLLALVFMVIEFAFYFGAIHYDNYAAFVAARGVEVGEDVSNAQSLLLNGNVTRDASIQRAAGSAGARVDQPWTVDFPGVNQLLDDIGFQVTAILGREEVRYEGQVNRRFADNNGGGV